MKILAIPSNYPYTGYPFVGIFNERCVLALQEFCIHIEILAPRPFVPKLLTFIPKCKAYASIIDFELRNGIAIHRPAKLWLPRLGTAFMADYGAYLFCRHLAIKLHRRVKFDVILSFNLRAGGLAFRMGQELGIPACGWAFGNDVRDSVSSPFGKLTARAIRNLDLIFYQSSELLAQAKKFIPNFQQKISTGKHIVLPHGINLPVISSYDRKRRLIRAQWRVSNDEIVVLNIGRVAIEKGILELLDAISVVSASYKKITCIFVGSMPAFDDSDIVKTRVENDSVLKRVRFLPACNPNDIWDHFCGADIFAFPSHNEGMPNSLLEAMSVGLPSIAFAIPAVEELDKKNNSLLKVKPFNVKQFAEAILKLANSPNERKRLGERGKLHVQENFDINKNMGRALEEMSKLIYKPHRKS